MNWVKGGRVTSRGKTKRNICSEYLSRIQRVARQRFETYRPCSERPTQRFGRVPSVKFQSPLPPQMCGPAAASTGSSTPIPGRNTEGAAGVRRASYFDVRPHRPKGRESDLSFTGRDMGHCLEQNGRQSGLLVHFLLRSSQPHDWDARVWCRMSTCDLRLQKKEPSICHVYGRPSSKMGKCRERRSTLGRPMPFPPARTDGTSQSFDKDGAPLRIGPGASTKRHALM